MRHKFLILTVKKLLKSVYIYGSYRKIKTGVSLFFGPPGIYTVFQKMFTPMTFIITVWNENQFK